VDQNEAQHSAKVQSGAELLCKSAKVGYKSIEYGVLSIGRYNVSGGGWQLQVAGGGKKTSSGLRSRLIGHQVRASGTGTGAGPEPVPDAEHLNLEPEGRDLGPENSLSP
jgi:hypothetical protein